MSLYDTERIIRKQQKYVKLKAYQAIADLNKKGLSGVKAIDALDILLDSDNSEFQQEVLAKAKSILKSQEENDDQENSLSDNVNRNHDDVRCPLLSFQCRL